MKKKNIIYSLLTLFLLAITPAVAQAQIVLTSIAEEDQTYLNIASEDLLKNFLKEGGSQTVKLTTNTDVSIRSDQSWCQATLAGNVLTITVAENNGAQERNAQIVVYGKDNNSQTIQVIQLGTALNILTGKESISITNDQPEFTLTVTCNVIFSIELPEWLTTADSPVIGFKEYTFAAAEIDEATGERKGEIVLKAAGLEDVKIPVTQSHLGYPTFAVISDIHFGNSNAEGPMVKVPRALKNLTSHKKLDALFIVGDLTESGTASQYTQLVSVLGNQANFTNPVDTIIYMMGNHDNYQGAAASQSNYSNGLKPLNNGKAYPLDQYIVIKGYPFITISQRDGNNTDANNESIGTSAYPKAVQDTLRAWMAKAAKECPGKPIFVFTHVPTKYTCYSSWPGEGDGTSWPTWSMKVLNPILNEYPQAVVFGGHSHFPLGDPRSIHQGVDPASDKKNFYTGVNTGSTTYSEIHRPSVDIGIHPEKNGYVTEGMIVTIQPNKDVEIRRYDTYRNVEMLPENPWMLKAPHDGSMFAYADIRDKDDNVNSLPLRDGLPAPTFATNDKVTISKVESNSVTVTFPQATDNECVFRYQIQIKRENGTVAASFFKFSEFYLTKDMPETFSVTLSGLVANTSYTAEVIAYDSYDNISEALVSETFKTVEDNDPANQPPARSGSWLFEDTADLLKATTGTALVPGTETTSGGVTEKNSAAEANIIAATGPSASNKAIAVPKLSLLKLMHGSAGTLNTYTIMYDVKVKTTGTYYCLLQTNLANTGDGDFFINQSAQLGLSVSGFGYGGTVSANTWHRIVFVVKNGIPTVYLDGSAVKEGTSADSRWTLAANATLLFADDSGEDNDIEVAEIGFWDKALTAKQVVNLGNIE